MDELFDGLDCRLRVSGLVADSIMMGIVNTAMEEAYRKVRSKEGDLERLNEKSRFCELAIMQLEWCLKFIQEEVDSYIDESSREREKLVSELIDARNQIQKRLEETELAIVEKDRELTERMENESRLIQALESKDEELKSLQIALKLERTKTERVREYVLSNQIRGDDDRDGSFYELKKSLDEQFWNIRQKLDDDRVHLADGMHQMKGSSSNVLKLDVFELKSELGLTEEGNYEMDEMSSSVKSSEEQNGSCKGIQFYENSRSSEVDVSNCCMQTKVTERNMEFKQMAVDIDTLEETVEVVFEQVRDALSSLKVELMEQQWERSVEKETLVLVLRGFLRDVEENFKAKSLDGQINFPLGFTGENWPSLIGDISSMRQELEKLLNIDNQLGIPPRHPSHVDIGDQGIPQKPMLLRCGKSDSSLMFKELQSLEDPPKEEMSRQAVHYVAEMIRNHESIIKRKHNERNWLKGENLRDKGRCIVERGMDLNHAKKMISEIISIFDRIIEGSSKQGISLNDYRWIYEKGKPSPHRKILESEEAKEEKTAVHMMPVEGPDKLGNILASNSIVMELKEGNRNLKQEREDIDIQTGIFKDTYKMVFKEFVNGVSLEIDNNGIVSSIKEDLYTVYLREVVREWITEKESYSIETAIREEINRINFSHVVEDINSFVNLQLVNYGEAWLQDTFPQDSTLANNFLQSSEIHKRNNLMQELDAFKALEGLMLSRNEVMDMDKQFDIGDWRLELGIESINYEEMLEDEDDAFSSVNSKLEKALQQTVMCKEQLKELSCSLDIVVGVREEANRQMAENEGILLDSPNGEKHWNALDSIVEPLKDFLRAITDFEGMAYDKMKVHIVRLDVAKRKLDPLIHFVPPPREEELLYKKAFVNRCYNLQTAETEVDLLGDKVDALLCLLEKIYMALYHHSPILKDNFGIKDILKLIRKELNGEVIVTSPQFS